MVSRLVVLISGNGSNLQAILDACVRGELTANVVAVISNKVDAYGLVRAKNAGVDTFYFPKRQDESRQEYDTRLAACVATYLPDYVVLAGWMRLLSSSFLAAFPNRVINLHPALPGMYPGLQAIARAFEAYQRGDIERTGVMVHLVPDEGVDNGPVLGQQEIEFRPGEGLADFEARVHEVEHKLLIDTLRNVLQKKET